MKSHRVVIRTTQKRYTQLVDLSQTRDTSLSAVLCDLLARGLESWQHEHLRNAPHRYPKGLRCMALQVRVPDELFQPIEDIADDMEYTRTDIYLRLIELGRESLDAENAS